MQRDLAEISGSSELNFSSVHFWGVVNDFIQTFWLYVSFPFGTSLLKNKNVEQTVAAFHKPFYYFKLIFNTVSKLTERKSLASVLDKLSVMLLIYKGDRDLLLSTKSY